MAKKSVLFLYAYLFLTTYSVAQISNRRPNIIVIYMDDVTNSEISSYGGYVDTPNIDQLAKTGIRFTRYYPSSPVCSASRFSLLTGEYASRSKSIQANYPLNTQAFIRWNTDITSEDYTIGRILKQHGYATGMVGKWHNFQKGLYGNLTAVPYIADPNAPQIQQKIEKNYQKTVLHVKRAGGFDFARAIYGTNLRWLPITKKLMVHNQHWVTYHSLQFIKKNKNNPFFLYISTTLPHGPNPLESLKNKKNIKATPDGYKVDQIGVQPSYASILERTNKAGPFKNREKKGKYAGMIWLDDSIGVILKKLDDVNLRGNTIILLVSDNGAAGKMVLNKGNIPFIANWKGHWPQGKVDRSLVSNIDFAPTIFQAAGVNPPPTMQLDGRSIIPLFGDGNPHWRKSLYREITYTRGIVTKNWKYIALRFPDSISNKVKNAPPGTYSQEGTRYSIGNANKVKVRYNSAKKFPGYYDADQLYYLPTDVDEQYNLAKKSKYQNQLKRMKDILRGYCKKLPHPFGEFTENKKIDKN